VVGGRQRRGARDEEPRPRDPVRDGRVGLGVGHEPVVHRRDAEEHRRVGPERGGCRRGRETLEVADRAPEPQRAEHAEDEPVHVEERQPVGEHVLAGPGPRARERVEVRRDRAAGQHDALGRPGGARRVDDHGGRLAVRLGREPAIAAGGDVDVGPLELAERAGQRHAGRGEDEPRCAVLDDVRELALARLRVDRHEGDAGGERADRGDARLERGDGPHGDGGRVLHALGDRPGGGGELAVAQPAIPDPDGLLGARVGERRQQRRVRHPPAGHIPRVRAPYPAAAQPFRRAAASLSRGGAPRPRRAGGRGRRCEGNAWRVRERTGVQG
jgi:hypothetical protein